MCKVFFQYKECMHLAICSSYNMTNLSLNMGKWQLSFLGFFVYIYIIDLLTWHTWHNHMQCAFFGYSSSLHAVYFSIGALACTLASWLSQYILLVRAFSSFAPIAKAWSAPIAEMHRVHEPPHKSAEQQCTISLQSSLGGQYKFPENFYLVSAVHWLHCEPQYTKPVTMTIQHCAKQKNIHRLSFATATGSQGTLPITFRQAHGNFIGYISDGEINLDCISGRIGLAVIQEGSDDRNYTAIPFYQRQTSSTYEIHLVVTWSTEAHLHVSGTYKFSIR